MRTTLFVGDIIVDGCDRRGIVVSTTLAREGARNCSFVLRHACLPEMVAGLLALKILDRKGFTKNSSSQRLTSSRSNRADCSS
jgi:hypothetical protein